MSKLSVVIFAAALLVGMCSTRSGAYAQNDERGVATHYCGTTPST